MPKSNRPNPADDPFLRHEALDRAAMLAAVFSDFIVEHPYVRGNPKLRAMADDLGERLADFYQAVGAEAFAKDEPARTKGRKSWQTTR